MVYPATAEGEAQVITRLAERLGQATDAAVREALEKVAQELAELSATLVAGQGITAAAAPLFPELAVAKKIVDEHEGSISVKSAPGEGTTFTIRLPVYHENVADPSQTHGPGR